jgi:hypothetical protein
MWVRAQTVRNKDGSTRTYLHLVQSRRVNGKVRQEIATLGRLDVLQGSGALDRLIASLARHSERRWVESEASISHHFILIKESCCSGTSPPVCVSYGGCQIWA